jgi:hypothetical protein
VNKADKSPDLRAFIHDTKRSPFITDQLLNRHPFNYIVQHLSSPQRRALFEKRLKNISLLRSKESLECKRIGERCCRRSRATWTPSGQSPSHRTASRSCLGLTIRRYGSGTPRLERRCRRSRVTRTSLATLSAISLRISAASTRDCSTSTASWIISRTSSRLILNLKGREIISILQEEGVSSYNDECARWYGTNYSDDYKT